MLENKYQQTSLLLSFNAAVMTSLEQKKRSHMKEETNHQRCLQSLQTLWFYAQLHLSDWTYREITYLLQAGCESCLSNKKNNTQQALVWAILLFTRGLFFKVKNAVVTNLYDNRANKCVSWASLYVTTLFSLILGLWSASLQPCLNVSII